MPQEPSSKRLISATQMSPVTESQLASGSDGDRIVDQLDAILKHLNISAPPPTASAVTQQPLA